MEIIEETTANWLVQDEDGTHDTIGKSPENKALINHNLWGLLRDGTEVFQATTVNDNDITLIPGDDAREFTLSVDDKDSLHLGPHHKSKLVDAIMDGKESDTEYGVAHELMRLYDGIRKNRVRTVVVSALAEKAPFAEKIEATADGWLIHGYLLLTWEGDFHHPGVQSYERKRSTVSEGSTEPAYELSVPNFSDPEQNRELTLGGESYRLTEAEMKFVAKALWAIAEAPEEV